MSATCTIPPRPPSKRLLFTAALVTGVTIGVWGIVGMGHFVFSGIPPERLAIYGAIGSGVLLVSGILVSRCAVQKHRRDAWWDGRSAGADHADEGEPLRRIKAELADLHAASADAVQRIEELTEAVFELADAAGRPRATSSPVPAATTYVSRGLQDDTIQLASPARSDGRVQVADHRAADPAEEARAQGYAEGYVDGIARRQEADGEMN